MITGAHLLLTRNISLDEFLRNRHPSSSAATKLGNIVSLLSRSSLQRSSILTCQHAWKLFDQFYLHISDTISYTLPISPHILALFIAYMFDRQYAPTTVNTYVSALGYSHKLFNLTDPTKVFFIMQMLKGYGKLGFRLDSRLPITLPILT